MTPSWLALGIDLRFLTTEEGGRSRSLGVAPYERYQYRPDWHLPGMPPNELSGAPVLCFGHFPIALGDTTRAVIVPFSEVSLTRWWRLVRPGERLEMHEGPRVCGIATVAWTAFTEQRISETDEAIFCSWTRGCQ